MSDQQVGETPNGFIVGADPQQRPMTQAEMQALQSNNGHMGVAPPQQQPVVITQQGQPTQPPPGRWFSEDDVARMRQEESARIAAISEQLQTLQQERDEREAAALAATAAAEEAERKREEDAMDVRQLLERKDQEWKAQIEGLRGEQERERAIFEQERRFAQVQDYRRNRLEQEVAEQNLLPELQDLVVGSSEDEIEHAIEIMRQRSATILNNVLSAVQPLPQQRPLAPRGVATTGQPPVGPMEQQETQTLSVDDIKRMDPRTYAQYRDKLMAVVSKAGPAGLKQQ